VRPFERKLRAQGFTAIAGLDEAGRGPLAGPVVAAAVILPENKRWPGIKDSKMLSAAQREEGFDLLSQKASAVGVGIVEVAEIDRCNIFRASLKAMEIAIQNLPSPPDYLLIDGNHGLKLGIPEEAVIHGDRLCTSIAAASIIAKVTRDRLMLQYHEQYPDYNFARHKGYSTQEHLDAIEKFGCCPIHRQSFKRIYQRQLL
jgi:ribonuclease HII